MLQAINDRIKGWLGIFVVAIIALPFAFWGIQSYTTGTSAQYAAKIDHIEISPAELERHFLVQKQRLMKQYGGQLPIEDNLLKKQVLDQLINQRLTEIITHEKGYRISDTGLSNNIQKLFSRDGEFSRVMYDSVRQSQNKSPAQFEQSIRNEMRVIQMSDGITRSGIAMMSEARRMAELEGQTREAALIRFRLDSFAGDVSVTEDEIRSVYDMEAERFMKPEKVKVEYVELRSGVVDNVKIDEQQIKEMYEQYVANLSSREKREASHILLKVGSNREETKKQLEKLREQIESGTSFSELAEEHSQDPVSAKQGGDLGWVEPGQMVEPFESALFSLEKGEVSGVIETQFGLHLIKLRDVQRAPIKPLVEMRAEFEKTLRSEAASNAFYELSETLAATAYENPDSLDAVVDIMNLKLQESDFFTRDNGTGIAANKAIRQAAFATGVIEQGNNSDVIELSPDHLVVLRVREHVLPEARPLDEVKTDIENVLRLRKAHELTLATSVDIKAKIESGEKVETLLTKEQKVEKTGAVKRNDASKLDQKLLSAIFDLSHPGEGNPEVKQVVLDSGDVVLVMLKKVNNPESLDHGRVASIRSRLKQETGNLDFLAVLSTLKDDANISTNLKVLQQDDTN